MESVKKYLYTCDHKQFWELTQETFQNRWFPGQINLASDIIGLQSLSEQDINFYKFLFTFLGMAETLVNFNIEELIKNFECHDIQHYYCEQMAMECIHSKVYFNILNMFFKNNIADTYAFAAEMFNDDALLMKVRWLEERVKNVATRAEKILVFLLIEGIFFISSFYSISLLRVRGIMPGVCMANDYISRDELLHTKAATLLYNTMIPINERPKVDWIQNFFKEAVEMEYNFIVAKSKGIALVNVKDIRAFLEATADRILKGIDVAPIYNTQPPANCPLTYTGCIKNVNFFERESTEYCMLVINDL